MDDRSFHFDQPTERCTRDGRKENGAGILRKSARGRAERNKDDEPKQGSLREKQPHGVSDFLREKGTALTHDGQEERAGLGLRPNGVRFALFDRIGNHKFHRLGETAVAADAVVACGIPEALAGGEDLFRIIVEGGDHGALEDQTDARHRV